MSQNALEEARKGNPKAIAALMSRHLNPQGITVKASLNERCLRVVLEGAKVPDEEAMTAFIRKGLSSLGTTAIERVKIYGQQAGEGIPAWNRDLELTGKLEIVEPVHHVEAQLVETPVQCPKCGSKQVIANKKGFGVGKAALGVVLLGPLGLAGGMLGSNEVLLSCVKCGNQWQPSKTVATPSTPATLNSKPSIKRVTEAKVHIPKDQENRSTAISVAAAGLILGLLCFMIPLIGWLFGIVLLAFAVVFPYNYLTGNRNFFAKLVGSCPHCLKEVATHLSPSHNFKCPHCKGKILVKEKQFQPIDG